MQPIIHILANGATVITTSPHAFRFSDGTVSQPQDLAVCNALTLAREFTNLCQIKGMRVNLTRMTLTTPQQWQLKALCLQADIVLVPFPVLAALREQGIRDDFPNALAFNATTETQRSAPDQKIVDIDNWSY